MPPPDCPTNLLKCADGSCAATCPSHPPTAGTTDCPSGGVRCADGGCRPDATFCGTTPPMPPPMCGAHPCGYTGGPSGAPEA